MIYVLLFSTLEVPIRRQFQRLAALAFALSLGLACAPTEADHVGDYLDARDEEAKATCACDWDVDDFWNGPYESVDECVATRTDSPARRACVSRLFADDPADHGSVFACRARAIDEKLACLDATKCYDTGAQGDCGEAFVAANGACPALPEALEEKFHECYVKND